MMVKEKGMCRAKTNITSRLGLQAERGKKLPKGFEHLWCQCLAAGAAEAGSRSGRPRSSLLEGQAQASAAACRVHECINTAALEPSRPSACLHAPPHKIGRSSRIVAETP